MFNYTLELEKLAKAFAKLIPTESIQKTFRSILVKILM